MNGNWCSRHRRRSYRLKKHLKSVKCEAQPAAKRRRLLTMSDVGNEIRLSYFILQLTPLGTGLHPISEWSWIRLPAVSTAAAVHDPRRRRLTFAGWQKKTMLRTSKSPRRINIGFEDFTVGYFYDHISLFIKTVLFPYSCFHEKNTRNGQRRRGH